ncbi:MAG: SDR family oxidoreductase [Acidobacteria bacterium]|nr:SDR family oxidoreductase [Acidobacteriota bacterium]
MNKTFLLIGGSYGIGFELAKSLSEAGNAVNVYSRTPGKVAGLAGVTHTQFDALTDELVVDGPIDGLAYMPGTIDLKPFHRFSDADLQRDLEVNYLGAARAIRSVLPNLKQADSASIVLFSTVAVQTGMPFHASIAGAKGAVEGLTRALAAEFAPKIQVNCVAPSLTDTPLAQKLLNTEQKKETAGERHPLRRHGTAKDIAEAAAFLLSDNSSWITGQVLHVDGGIGHLK